MSIMSDRWIAQQNRRPKYALMIGERRLGWLSPPYDHTEQSLINHYNHSMKDSLYLTYSNDDPHVVAVTGDDFIPMISSAVDSSIREVDGVKIFSYGLSSYGYDVRLAEDFKIFTNINSAIIDPKALSAQTYVDHTGPYCIIPPNSYILGHTVESFNIPDDIMAICLGKSSYARAGVLINTTPIEAGFVGQVVIEIANVTNLPIKVYANEGIAQFLFLRGNERCDVSYGDRAGKYQNQQGITLPKV